MHSWHPDATLDLKQKQSVGIYSCNLSHRPRAREGNQGVRSSTELPFHHSDEVGMATDPCYEWPLTLATDHLILSTS
jgi:hypothetical protein